MAARAAPDRRRRTGRWLVVACPSVASSPAAAGRARIGAARRDRRPGRRLAPVRPAALGRRAPSWSPAGGPARGRRHRAVPQLAGPGRPCRPRQPVRRARHDRPGRPARADPEERRGARVVPAAVALRLAAGHVVRRRGLRPDRPPDRTRVRALALPAGGAGAGRQLPGPLPDRRLRPAGPAAASRRTARAGRCGPSTRSWPPHPRTAGPTIAQQPSSRWSTGRSAGCSTAPPARARCRRRAATTGSGGRPG